MENFEIIEALKKVKAFLTINQKAEIARVIDLAVKTKDLQFDYYIFEFNPESYHFLRDHFVLGVNVVPAAFQLYLFSCLTPQLFENSDQYKINASFLKFLSVNEKKNAVIKVKIDQTKRAAFILNHSDEVCSMFNLVKESEGRCLNFEAAKGTSVSADKIYQFCKNVGLDLGPSYKLFHQVEIAENHIWGESRALVGENFPEAMLIDSISQALLYLGHHKGFIHDGDTFVPIGFDGMRLGLGLPRNIKFQAKLKNINNGIISGELGIYDQDQKYLGGIENWVLKKHENAHYSKDFVIKPAVFETKLNVSNFPSLNDHVVHREIVVPGAFYTTLSYHHLRKLYPRQKRFQFNSIEYSKPRILTPDLSFEMQLKVHAGKSQEFSVELATAQMDSGPKWERNLTLKARALTEAEASPAQVKINLQSYFEDAHSIFSDSTVLDKQRIAGLNAGPSFQWMQKVWLGENFVLSKFNNTNLKNLVSEYTFPPGMFDAFFQQLGFIKNFNEHRDDNGVYIPLSIEQLSFYNDFTEDMYCLAQINEINKKVITGNIQLFNKDNVMICHLSGVQLIQTDKKLSKKETTDLSALAFIQKWNAIKPFISLGKTPLRPDELTINLTTEEFLKETYDSEYVAIRLKAIIDEVKKTPLKKINFVTYLGVNFQSANPNMVSSAYVGAIRSLRAEMNDLQIRLIDCDRKADEKNIGNIVGETKLHLESLIRTNSIYVPQFVSAPESNESQGLVFKSDGTYLITGGLGGVGERVIRGLKAKGVNNIFIIGKSAIDANREKVLNELKKDFKNVYYLACDLGQSSVHEAIINFMTKNHIQLQGIFHCAGLIKDKLAMTLEKEQIAEVINAKVLGAIALRNVVDHFKQNLDFMVLFSSIVSKVGSRGQFAYCAANSLLDSYGVLLRKEIPNTYVVNWGPWLEAGGFNRLEEKQKDYFHKELGMTAAASSDLVECLFRVNQFSGKDLVFAKLLPNFQYKWAEVELSNKIPENADETAIPAPVIGNVDHSKIESIFSEVAAASISSKIDFNKTAAENGLDSMMAVEIRATINESFNVKTSLAIYFEDRPLRKTIEVIAGQIK